jgi:hypothetical protein
MANFYVKDMVWGDVIKVASNLSTNMRDASEAWIRTYNNWQAVVAEHGPSHAALATHFGVATEDIDAIAAAFAAAKAVRDQLDNQPVSQADHLFALRKFFPAG